jgi:hypothetical protein
MDTWKETLKPRGSRRLQLLLAGAMWGIVGSALLGVGAFWITADGLSLPRGLLLGASVAIGLIKSRYVLDRSAVKIVNRVARRGEGRCLGGFLSLRSWGLVLLMVVFGRSLRQLLHPVAAGCLYAAVGTGLLLSSRISWLAWRRMK